MTPDAARPLGRVGTDVWDRIWASISVDETNGSLVEIALMVAEQADERYALRAKVIREQSWRDRTALRALDAQLAANLAAIIDRTTNGNADDSQIDDLLAALGDPS